MTVGDVTYRSPLGNYPSTDEGAGHLKRLGLPNDLHSKTDLVMAFYIHSTVYLEGHDLVWK
jgi:hypothetical protein